MNYQKLAKSKGLKCLKAADYTNSNDFVNAVNDLLKKYIDLIHKRQKNYLESGKETQNAITLKSRRADRVTCLRK